MDRHPETLGRETVFTGRKIALELHRVRSADGRETTREVVRHNGSVAILAFPQPGRVLLERIWRQAVGRVMLEIPAGTLEPGEAPAACAVRELAEETGYRAGRVEPVLKLNPSPGILSEEMTLFRAYDLVAGPAACEADEDIETVLVPLDEAAAMIADGKITDAKTIAAILYERQFPTAERAVGMTND